MANAKSVVNPDPYVLPEAELLRLEREARQAATNNGGHNDGWIDEADADFFAGILVARQHNQSPPFQPGQKVRYTMSEAKPVFTVARCIFTNRTGQYTWGLQLKEAGSGLTPTEATYYDARHFVAV